MIMGGCGSASSKRERPTLGRLEEQHSNLGTTGAGRINGQHVRGEGDTDMFKSSSEMLRVLPAHGWLTRCLWLQFFGLPTLVPAVRRAEGSLQSLQETAHLLLYSQCPECHHLDTPPLVLSVTTELV